MVLLLVFMQLTRDLFAIAKFLLKIWLLTQLYSLRRCWFSITIPNIMKVRIRQRETKLRYRQRRVYITDRLRCRLVNIRGQRRWTSSSIGLSLTDWHFNYSQPKNSVSLNSKLCIASKDSSTICRLAFNRWYHSASPCCTNILKLFTALNILLYDIHTT